MIRSPWSRVSIIFSAWLKLILWKFGWAITRFIYAAETEEKQHRIRGEVWMFVLLAVLIQTTLTTSVIILTCSLLFLFEVLFLFLVFSLFVKVIVAVLGKLPLIGLVHQIRGAACEVHAEFLNVDFHDAAVNRHTHLKEEKGRGAIQFDICATIDGNKTGRTEIARHQLITISNIYIFLGGIYLKEYGNIV